jgi:hypothetical protein
MTSRRTGLLICVCLTLLAGALRFYRLGDWPFWRDEMETSLEVRSLIESTPLPDGQNYRLPRLIPLSYSLLTLGQRAFGADEFGSRVLPALFGVLQILLVFVLLDRSAGRSTALATALLMTFWPDHINRSQENRFYTIGAVLAALSILAGALAVRRRSLGWAVTAAAAAAVGVLAHTLLALLLGGLFVGWLAAAWVRRDRRLARLAWVVPAAGFLLVPLFLFYLLPLGRGWNAGEYFGYGVGQSVLSAACLLGWPVMLLAGLGVLLTVRRPTALNVYWLSWAALSAALVVLLPLVVVYHAEYGFLFALGLLVPAGRGVAVIYERLRGHHRLAGWAWLGAACMLNLPSLASHYLDGSRLDFRVTARYVAAHARTGDHVSSFSPRVFRHYAPQGLDVKSLLPFHEAGAVERLTGGSGRLWIVVFSQRGGKEKALEDWLGRHCSLRFVHRPRRFDYFENATEVYLFSPPEDARATRPAGPAFAQAGGKGGNE